MCAGKANEKRKKQVKKAGYKAHGHTRLQKNPCL